jgi:hypothetical protein
VSYLAANPIFLGPSAFLGNGGTLHRTRHRRGLGQTYGELSTPNTPTEIAKSIASGAEGIFALGTGINPTVLAPSVFGAPTPIFPSSTSTPAATAGTTPINLAVPPGPTAPPLPSPSIIQMISNAWQNAFTNTPITAQQKQANITAEQNALIQAGMDPATALAQATSDQEGITTVVSQPGAFPSTQFTSSSDDSLVSLGSESFLDFLNTNALWIALGAVVIWILPKYL